MQRHQRVTQLFRTVRLAVHRGVWVETRAPFACEDVQPFAAPPHLPTRIPKTVHHVYIAPPEGAFPFASYLAVVSASVVLTPDAGQEGYGCNVDGEVLPGPGPFRIHLMPSMLTAFGEV